MRSDLPKVLQPLAGRPLLRHVLDTAKQLQPAATCIVVYGHGGDAVRAAFASESLQWALQAEQKGTGHAVMQAMPDVPDDHLVLVLYGDVPLLREATLRELLKLAGPKQLALLTVKLADPDGLRPGGARCRRPREGDRRTQGCETCAAEDQRGQHGRARGAGEAAAGLAGQAAQQQCAGRVLPHRHHRDGRARRLPRGAAAGCDETEVLGVNDRLQLAQLESAVRRECAEQAMREGATLADPARFDQRGELTVGRDVFIDVNVVFEGRVVLGDRVRIGPNCVLRNVAIGADTVVHAQLGARAGRGGQRAAASGPFARLRPGAKLGDDVHIGNYVEVKNSTLGKGAKANHLTYLGDATVGAGVNVGAGTVCCNYDGVNKSRTVIDEGAFIGSGSMLVAPVTIGAQATVGAGSTITQDVAGRAS